MPIVEIRIAYKYLYCSATVGYSTLPSAFPLGVVQTSHGYCLLPYETLPLPYSQLFSYRATVDWLGVDIWLKLVLLKILRELWESFPFGGTEFIRCETWELPAQRRNPTERLRPWRKHTFCRLSVQSFNNRILWYTSYIFSLCLSLPLTKKNPGDHIDTVHRTDVLLKARRLLTSK